MGGTGMPVPGPGTYTPVPVHRSVSPAYSIGRSTKLFEPGQRAKTPSPADYRPKVPLRSTPSYAIGLTKRHLGQTVNPDFPGPGAYTPRQRDSAPQFSMKLKLTATQKTDQLTNPVPSNQGPGHYSPNTSQVLEKPKMPVIGSEQKFANVKYTHGPSPGGYDISRELKGPRYSFTRSLRRPRAADLVPGPGQYTIPSGVANVPSYARLKKTID